MKCHNVTRSSLRSNPAVRTALAIGVLSAAWLSTPVLAQSSNSDKSDVTELDTVVVESSKSNQSYLDSNSSVQVISTKKLEEADAQGVQDLSKVVPGLVIEARGNRTYATSTLRGISSANYFSPSMSIYVDGVLQDGAFTMQELTNVKSVEVLKGPQGTLFGGNSHGGIINIVTYKGSDDPFAQIDLSADQITQRGKAILSAPIGEGFSVDLTLFRENIAGTIDNVTTGSKKSDGSTQSAGTLGFHYKNSYSPFSANLKLRVDDLDSNEELYISEQEFKDKKTSPTNFFASTDPKLDRELKSATFDMAYDITDSVAIEAVVGVSDRKSDRQIIGGNYDEEQDRTSQELRLKSTSEQGTQFVLGLYNERSEFRYDSRVPMPTGGIFARKNRVAVNNMAVFADAKIPVTPVLDVSAGVRYGVDASNIDFIAGFPGGDFVRDRRDNIFLPKLGIGYKLTENSKLFATASAGYRPSGYNFIPSGPAENAGYGAELSKNYEIGYKTAGPGQALAFNTALYFIQLEDVQVYTGVMPNQILSNLGNAESKGVELDATYAFNKDRSTNVSLGLAWGKAAYTSGNEEAGVGGNRLQYSPETTANMTFQVKVPQDSLSGKVLVGGSGRFRSKFYFDEANSLSQGDHSVFDAHVKYLTNSGSSVRIFSKNLTDTKYASYKFGGFGGSGSFGTWGRRFTVGLAGTLML